MGNALHEAVFHIFIFLTVDRFNFKYFMSWYNTGGAILSFFIQPKLISVINKLFIYMISRCYKVLIFCITNNIFYYIYFFKTRMNTSQIVYLFLKNPPHLRKHTNVWTFINDKYFNTGQIYSTKPTSEHKWSIFSINIKSYDHFAFIQIGFKSLK